MITDKELTKRMEDISKNFSPTLSYSMMQYDKILNKIIRIVKDARKEQLLSYDPHTLVTYTLKILLYYDNRLHADRLCEWKRRRKLKIVWDYYHAVLRNYLPEKSQEVVKAIIDTVYQDRLWKLETFCFELMCSLLHVNSISGAFITNVICDRIESMSDINDTEDARGMIRVLYELLEVYKWPATEETVLTVERMLALYHASIMDARSTISDSSTSLAYLKKGLEVCLRNTIKHLSNYQLLVIVQHMCSWTVAVDTTDEIVLEFGSILEFTAYMHQTDIYEQTLTPTIFPLLIRMVGSTSRLTSLLGNRVLQYLLDRNGNRAVFDTPRIFFESTEFDLRTSPCRKEDRLFLKLYRELLHDGLLKSMINHSESRINLETTYCTICLIAVELSCGFTAAALVCLAMNLQEIALQRQNSYLEVACHVHATVISVMSLLCWIHKAKVFYNYVNRIMMERAQWAPHLNPPIQSQYSFAVHHVLWNKPELFFIDWETRFGLWKCFRLADIHDDT